MINKPEVSVVMPAYNAEKYIADAIESILGQTFKDFELIIIDDCSTDKTSEIIASYAKLDKRVSSVRNNKNMKICETLNRGISISSGKYIARMDADDEAVRSRLEKQFSFLEKNPKVVVVGASINVCDGDLSKINVRNYNKSDQMIRNKIFRYNQFCHPVVMMRKDAVDKVGGYNPRLYDAEDYDLYFRLGQFGEFANLGDILLNYRTSKSSISARRGRRQELLTLYVRMKASLEYGYRMRPSDKAYSFLQLLSMALIPQRVKFWLFNFIRRN